MCAVTVRVMPRAGRRYHSVAVAPPLVLFNRMPVPLRFTVAGIGHSREAGRLAPGESASLHHVTLEMSPTMSFTLESFAPSTPIPVQQLRAKRRVRSLLVQLRLCCVGVVHAHACACECTCVCVCFCTFVLVVRHTLCMCGAAPLVCSASSCEARRKPPTVV